MDETKAMIAGYPLVRALRRDAEREVWVGADASGGVEVHRGLVGGDALLAREAEAVLLAGHAHLVPILDVAVDGGCVIVRPLLPMDLAAWLVQRYAPAPGEAVTALVPVAAALGALHAVGASGGGCIAGDVRLDADGAPMLLAAGARAETPRPTDAWRASSEGVAADVAGWRQLAAAVLEAAGAELPDGVERALEHQDLAGAGAELLRAWPALPLELEAAAPVDGEPRVRMRRRERAVGPDAILARLALLAERAAELGGPLAQRALAGGSNVLGGVLGAVRPRFWLIGGGGAVALIAAAVLLWPAGAADAGQQVPAVPPSPSEATPVPADESADPPAAPTATAAAAGEEPSGADDDPVAAAAALLAEREACLAADDAACLVALHEPGSPQLTAEAPWRLPDDGTLELVQRLGDAWLLRVRSEREPASVLVMSTEAGWTLRDAWLLPEDSRP